MGVSDRSLADDKQTKDDVVAVRAYLEKSKPGKRWDIGPARIDSAEIRQAFPQSRFYMVSSTVPGPYISGVPPSPAQIEAHQKANAEKMKNYISLTVRIDATGMITPVDYKAGLMPIQSDADARTAAAAILSLHQESGGPIHVPAGALPAKDVKVVKTDKGWTCTVPLPKANLGFSGTWGGTGTVTFNVAGQPVDVAKQVLMTMPYAGPYPPSAPKK
jgi:hypothetical protein